MFLVNSRLGHFSAASESSPGEPDHRQRHPLFRSYGVKLPSSLTRVISSTLGYSPHPPASVYGTDGCKTRIEAFLGSLIRVSWLARRLVSPSGLGVNESPDFPRLSSYTLRRPSIRALSFHSCVTPSYKRNQPGSGILTGFPSSTPFGLNLGTDLP